MSIFRLLSASALARPLRSKNWTALHVNQVVCAATAPKGSLNHQYVESKDYNCKTKSRAWWVPAQRERDLRDIQKGKGCGDEELAFDHHRIHSSDQFPFPTKTLQQKCVQLRSLRAAASTERFGAIERERNPAHSCHDASRQYSSVKREVSNEGRDTEKQGRKASEGLGGPAPTTPITENAGVGSGGSMNAGWSYEEACTVPNLVSLARALSAPWLGLCIINDQWEIAIGKSYKYNWGHLGFTLSAFLCLSFSSEASDFLPRTYLSSNSESMLNNIIAFSFLGPSYQLGLLSQASATGWTVIWRKG